MMGKYRSVSSLTKFDSIGASYLLPLIQLRESTAKLGKLDRCFVDLSKEYYTENCRHVGLVLKIQHTRQLCANDYPTVSKNRQRTELDSRLVTSFIADCHWQPR